MMMPYVKSTLFWEDFHVGKHNMLHCSDGSNNENPLATWWRTSSGIQYSVVQYMAWVLLPSGMNT
jgi:hypothetical protein